MTSQERVDLARLGAAIAAGTSGALVVLTIDEFKELHGILLKRLDSPQRAKLYVALVNGRAVAGFPTLSRQVIAVRGKRGNVTREDFDFPTAAETTVVGAETRPFHATLLDDLRHTWLVSLLVVLGLLGTYWLGAATEVVGPVATALTLASGLFFAVFVLFGVGEIVRSTQLARQLFVTGVLQQSLDSDRYLVRLAIVGFACAIGATLVLAVQGKLLAGFPQLDSMAVRPVEVAGLLLLGISLIAVILSLRAAVVYLLDRASETALMAAASDAFETEYAVTGTRPSGSGDAREIATHFEGE